jgi:hypothetical protein
MFIMKEIIQYNIGHELIPDIKKCKIIIICVIMISSVNCLYVQLVD